jgi:flagellar biosynthesis/type III secretory pathway M-ring protein FliF/YscJ
LKLGQQWTREKKGQLLAKERFFHLLLLLIFFCFLFCNIFFIVQHIRKQIKEKSTKNNGRQETKPKKKKKNATCGQPYKESSRWMEKARKLEDSQLETVPEVGDLAGGEVIGEGCRKRHRRWCCSEAHKLCGKVPLICIFFFKWKRRDIGLM